MLRLLAASALALTVGLGGATGARAAEFIIGSELPLTGPLARVGQGMNEGIQVAAEIFNRTNGRHTVKVITVDDETQPAKAIAAIEKLNSEGAIAFTGGYGSNIIGPASDTAERLGKVYITSGGVATELSHRGLKTFFRINNAAGYAKALAGFYRDQGIRSVSVLYSTREATQEVARMLEKDWQASGIVVTMHPFDASVTDFKPIMHKIKVIDRPEAIAMIGYENDYVGIIRAARVFTPDVKAIGGVWSLTTTKMWKDFPELMNNVYGTSTVSYPPKFLTEQERVFAEVYEQMFGKDVDYLGIYGYVQSTLLFNAVAEAHDAGDPSTEGIIRALHSKEHETLIGTVRFDEGGDNVNFSHRIGQHQAGQIPIVWPPEAQTGPATFPGVAW